MNNNTHTFTVENIGGSEGIYPEVHMKIDGQASIIQFELFRKSFTLLGER